MTIISGHTKIVGILGYPITHTLSPKMHNAAFRHLGLDYIYLPFKVKPEQLKQAMNGLKGLNIAGVNVTVPHKVHVVEYLDKVSKEAEQLGAVNAIKLEGERLLGYNTDGQGFITSLRVDANTDYKGKTILLLGAGGAAQAVAVSLADQGAGCIAIANRTLKKAEALVNKIRYIAPRVETACLPLGGSELDRYTAEAQIIINATSVGLKSNDMPPVNENRFHAGQLVCDLIYNPPKTRFLAAAESQGAKILNGLGMLVYQGALAFEIWTGKKAPVEVMRKAIITNS
jgi:shikimate dehydrogenase